MTAKNLRPLKPFPGIHLEGRYFTTALDGSNADDRVGMKGLGS